MATIENHGALDATLFTDMTEEQLLAQDLVQQGAIHAVSFLLKRGCNKKTATDMLVSMRENARLIRAEADRRGKPSMFAQDQTATN